MDKTEKFKQVTAEKEREQKAIALYNQLKTWRMNLFGSAIKIGAIMRIIKDEKLYEKLIDDKNGDISFSAFCAFELPQLDSGTIKKYMDAAEFLESIGVEIDMEKPDNLDGLAVNKILLLKQCREPEKWIEPMKTMPISDLKKEIDEKEHGIKPDEKEIENHIKQAEKVKACPFGDFKCGRKSNE
jgi:hypothetical protein